MNFFKRVWPFNRKNKPQPETPVVFEIPTDNQFTFCELYDAAQDAITEGKSCTFERLQLWSFIANLLPEEHRSGKSLYRIGWKGVCPQIEIYNHKPNSEQ